MKVMLVNGSSHLHGTTMTALEEMIKVFHSEEVETEVVQLGGKPIADCLQCNVCQKTGKCVIKNDGVNEFVEKAKTADGFVFATPVYFAHPSGRIYDFLDRVFYSAGGYDAFKFKPGAAVAVARRGGTTAALDGINKYLGIAQMPVAGSTYWNMVYGLYGEEAFQDEEGMQTMRNLARNMIWMMRCFKLGRESIFNDIPALDEKRKQKKNRPDGKVPCRSVFISFFPVFTYLHQYNCTMYIWRFRNNLQPYLRIW